MFWISAQNSFHYIPGLYLSVTCGGQYYRTSSTQQRVIEQLVPGTVLGVRETTVDTMSRDSVSLDLQSTWGRDTRRWQGGCDGALLFYGSCSEKVTFIQRRKEWGNPPRSSAFWRDSMSVCVPLGWRLKGQCGCRKVNGGDRVTEVGERARSWRALSTVGRLSISFWVR